MQTISYAITCHNELDELRRLLDQLLIYVRPDDEIVIQQDNPGDGSQEYNSTEKLIEMYKQEHKNVIKAIKYPLNGDFSKFKNNIKYNCTKDYVFFLDADETVSNNLLEYLPLVLENNEVDLIITPRANTVKGITDEHIRMWGWRVENGLINWPDFQGRIVKNVDYMFWHGKVHEKVVGFETLSQLPIDNFDWCLHHDKDIIKQEKQNKLYSTI